MAWYSTILLYQCVVLLMHTVVECAVAASSVSTYAAIALQRILLVLLLAEIVWSLTLAAS